MPLPPNIIIKIKKALVSTFLLGQEPYSLLRYHPTWPAYSTSPLFSRTAMRASLVTGEAPVAPNLSFSEARIALVSPFAVVSFAAIAPPAALLERLHHGYYSYSPVCRFGFVAIICRDASSVNSFLQKMLSAGCDPCNALLFGAFHAMIRNCLQSLLPKKELFS